MKNNSEYNMKNNNTFREQMLERIREDKQPETSQKKRKLSKILIIVDGILIALILLFMYNKDDNRLYQSTSLDFDNVRYRFSVGLDEDTNNHLFTLSMKSLAKKEKSINYYNSIAKLYIYHNLVLITENEIAPEVKKVKFLPGEVKTFVIPLEETKIIAYIKKNPDSVPKGIRSLIQFEGAQLPLEAKIIINVKNKVSTHLHFNYEVKQ
jgi:hypothetical protein